MINNKPIYVIPIIVAVALSIVAVIITLSFNHPYSDIKINDGIAKDDRHIVSIDGLGSFKTSNRVESIYTTDSSILYKVSDFTYVMLSDLNSQTSIDSDCSEIKSKIFGIDNDISDNTLNYIANLFNNGYVVERISIRNTNGFLVSESSNFGSDPIKSVALNRGIDISDKNAVHFITCDGRMISVLSNNEDEQLELISSYSERN